MPRTTSESPYADVIRLAASYDPKYDVRHIEAYMRVDHPTLDALPMWRFDQEVAIAISAIEMGGLRNAEYLAVALGFTLPSEWEG